MAKIKAASAPEVVEDKGFVAIQYMDADHPDDPTQHVQVIKDATEAGVYDYRV